VANEFRCFCFQVCGSIEIGTDTILEASRLADIEQIATMISHQVDAWRSRQCGYDFGRDMAFNSSASRASRMMIEQAVEPLETHLHGDFEENRKNFRCHARIAESAMASFGRQPEMLSEQVEPAPFQRRHQLSRHLHSTQNRIGQADAEQPAELEIQERSIKLCIVRDHHRVAQESAKFGQYFLYWRGCGNHFVGDRGQLHHEARNAQPGTHQALKGGGNPPSLHPISANLDY